MLNLFLICALAGPLESKAAVAEATIVDSDSIESELTSEFLLMMAPVRAHASRWNQLTPRIVAALRERTRVEPARATKYAMRPWRQTIRGRVEILADRFAFLLAEPTIADAADVRADRALDVFVDLTAALSRNVGGDSPVTVPTIAGVGGLWAGAAAAYGFDHDAVALLLGPLGAAVGVGGATFNSSLPATNHATKLAVARDMAEIFWDQVGWKWRQLAPADLAGVATEPDAVSAAADAKLAIDGSTLVDACERWLVRARPPAPQI